MRNQVYNPFLPLNEYIPDGEPHVFGDRVYLFGSHDKEGGYTFCMEDYTVYSAPVNDLTSWQKKALFIKSSQDPLYPKFKYMYAPDVVCGMTEGTISITACPVITVLEGIQIL